MMIDAHQHFWRPARGDYGWLGPHLPVLNRDFLPEHLAGFLTRCGVTATVAVQAAPTEAETAFLLELARADPFIVGVVGWTDFEAAGAPQRIRMLAASGAGLLKGFRPMLQDLEDPAWVARPSLDAAFAALASEGLAFDALVKPPHLEYLLQRLERSPGVRYCVDHCAKPSISAAGPDSRAFQSWATALERVAAFPNVWCKLSGLVTEVDASCRTTAATIAVLEPWVRQVFRSFGPDRILWGSDWPVLNLASDYETWFRAARALVEQIAPGHVERVFGGTAAEFYCLTSLPDGSTAPLMGRS